jgi:hypothetical protein
LRRTRKNEIQVKEERKMRRKMWIQSSKKLREKRCSE